MSELAIEYRSVNSLSLYRYARILGINPVHFSTAGDIPVSDGSVLFPLSDGRKFYQAESYHPAEGVSRDEINEMIGDAESLVEDFLGSHVTPKWTRNENVNLKEHYSPLAGYNTRNVRGERVLYTPKWNNFLSGGGRASDLIEENVSVVYSDPDEDGWNELATIEFDLTEDVSLYEIHCYFSEYGGSESYEIRPPLSKTKDGLSVKIVFETWKMIDPVVAEEFPTNDRNKLVDLTDSDNLAATVDIYRVYNDTTQSHAVFLYETSPNDFDYSEQSGYIKFANPDINGIEIVPADYDDGWQRKVISGKLKYIKLNYQSGFSYRPVSDTNYWDDLHPDLARAIAYLATARLSRPLAGKPEVTALSEKLQQDLAETVQGMFRFTTNDILDNPFGSLAGEVFAWRRLKNFKRKFKKYRN